MVRDEEELEVEDGVEPLASDGLDGQGAPYPGPNFGGVRIPPLTTEERRQLRAVHVNVRNVSIFEDIRQTNNLICDNSVRIVEPEADSDKELISNGMVFYILGELKHWLRDYSVHHHRPYDVVHSYAKVRCTVWCQKGCGWGVWAQPMIGDGS